MLATVLLFTGFVVAVLAILGLTPRLEEWATTTPAAPPGPEADHDVLEGAAHS